MCITLSGLLTDAHGLARSNEILPRTASTLLDVALRHLFLTNLEEDGSRQG